MKKRYVISNVPVRLPLTSTILYSFLLYHFQVNGIWWGIFISFYFLYWLLVIVLKFNEKRIDLNSDELKDDKKVMQSKFAQRLQKMMEERKTEK